MSLGSKFYRDSWIKLSILTVGLGVFLWAFAQGEAKAIGSIAEAIGARSNPANYLIAIKYIDALKELSKGQSKTVFLPYEATGVLSSLGGIKEMFAAGGKS